MFLRRLQLTNIRSIEHLDLSFKDGERGTRKWSLILGENGTGKTCLLKSVALIVAGSEALPELLAYPDHWIRRGEQACAIEAELVTAEGEVRQIALRWARGEHVRDIFQRNKDAMDRLDAALRHTNRNYFTLGYGATRRLAGTRTSGPAGEVFRHPRAQNVGTLFSNDAVLNPLDTWAMDLEYRKSQAGLSVVRDALGDLLPGLTLSRIDRENRELLFDTPDGELPLAQLSEGYQNMAAWCGDLLYRITETYQDYRHPLRARGLLLVDEIDLHLHPVWQRVLKKFLDQKLTNFQVIATTHSPLTAQQAGEGELYFLKREHERGPSRLEQFSGVPNLSLVHQVLLSPAFGIPSMNSEKVEALKREYRELQSADASLTRTQKTRLNRIREQLSDVPDWTRETPTDRRQTELLTRIESALETLPESRNGGRRRNPSS